jgi:endonuclease G
MKKRWTLGLALIASVVAYAAERRPWTHAATRSAPYAQGQDGSRPSPSTTGADTARGDCRATHPSATPPMMPEKLMRSSVVRCRTSFEILHSGLTRTPLWVSERLTPQSVAAARGLERVDSFEPDRTLPSSARAELSDYRGSGWDRGHMAPNGDMADVTSQRESFELSNMSPQAPSLNRGPWADLESDVRRHVARNGMAYVVTGVLFEGATLGTLPGGRVAIPTSLWKAVLSPDMGSIVMVARNEDGADPVPMSIDAFRARTGIDPFPSISSEDRSNMLRLDPRNAR